MTPALTPASPPASRYLGVELPTAQASDASRVISGTPASARLTGQPALAAAAASANVLASMPGTRPTVTSAILVIVGAPSTGRRVTVASVRTESGGFPACARMFDRAIEKHDACAAAMSCSGLAPGPSSKRDLNEYSPLIVSPAVNVPFPEGTSPFHSALPFAGMPASSVATNDLPRKRSYGQPGLPLGADTHLGAG